MSETKRFSVRTILTCTTGRLLTETDAEHDGNGIGWLYELLGWMTNDSPFTHQLGRFSDECKPWLLRWFPELAKAEALLPALDDAIDKLGGERGCQFWIDSITLPKHYDVPRIPRDDHEHKNPYDELVAMRGTDEGIVIVDAEKA